jgi:hypothetical protein
VAHDPTPFQSKNPNPGNKNVKSVLGDEIIRMRRDATETKIEERMKGTEKQRE